MRRLDHAMIFALIPAFYTPFALLALHGSFSTVVLLGVWGGAAGGIVLQLLSIDAPKWLSAGVYIALGWFATVAAPELLAQLNPLAPVLLRPRGLLYTRRALPY